MISESKKSLNATFITLVPRRGGIENLKDFIQIGFVDGIYKLLCPSPEIEKR